MDDKVRICFDKEYKIRALQPDKFGHAEELEKECSNFVESKQFYLKLIINCA